jgi:hypothetical protein
MQPQRPFLPSAVPPPGSGIVQTGPSSVDQQAMAGQTVADFDVVVSKPGKC